MRRLAVLALTLALQTCSGGHPAYAQSVYPGCSPAPGVSQGHFWYIDAVNGKTAAAGGDGSQAHPWNSFKAVTGTKTAGVFGPDAGYSAPLLASVKEGKGGGTGPIQPGDTIVLNSGNYGDIAIGDFNNEVTNSNWVIVAGARGQTPVFSTLLVTRTNKWLFNSIKVQSAKNANVQALVTVGDQGAAFPTSDIAFNNVDISTADHAVTQSWSAATWLANARNGFVAFGSAGNGFNGEPYTTCVSLVYSHVHDVYNGVDVFANQMLVSHNEIDHFGADGLDYGANNIAITLNNEHDNFTVDANHEDAMQGQNGPLATGVAFNHFSNILIDSNRITRQMDPNLQLVSYLQGIDAFDEDWTNVTVTNNVIITSSCWGIGFQSIHNSLIAGNTVLDDGQIATPGCTDLINLGGKTHEGPSSSNVRVTNNLGDRFVVGASGDTGMTFDNNVALNSYEPFGYWDQVAGAFVFQVPASWNGTNGNMTTQVAIPYGNVLTTWDPADHIFNAQIKAGAMTLGHGSALPATDIMARARVAPLTPGAFGYPF